MTSFFELPPSPTAVFLGLRFLSHDPHSHCVRLAFEPRMELLNPAGVVQGGFVTAMLDDCTGPAVWFHTDGKLFTVTIALNVSFLAPAPLEPLIGEGKVIQLGKTVGFVDACLMSQQNQVLARATATVRLVPTDRIVLGGAHRARAISE